MTDTRTPTLYDWAGGADAFDRLTELFYRKVHQDPLLGPLFARVGPDHAHHVALWLAEVFGGPSRYTDELGGYPAMMRPHLGLHITEAQRRGQLLHQLREVVQLPVRRPASALRDLVRLLADPSPDRRVRPLRRRGGVELTGCHGHAQAYDVAGAGSSEGPGSNMPS